MIKVAFDGEWPGRARCIVCLLDGLEIVGTERTESNARPFGSRLPSQGAYGFLRFHAPEPERLVETRVDVGKQEPEGLPARRGILEDTSEHGASMPAPAMFAWSEDGTDPAGAPPRTTDADLRVIDLETRNDPSPVVGPDEDLESRAGPGKSREFSPHVPVIDRGEPRSPEGMRSGIDLVFQVRGGHPERAGAGIGAHRGRVRRSPSGTRSD